MTMLGMSDFHITHLSSSSLGVAGGVRCRDILDKDENNGFCSHVAWLASKKLFVKPRTKTKFKVYDNAISHKPLAISIFKSCFPGSLESGAH